MGVFLVTDQLHVKKQLEYFLLSNGYLVFHSVDINENIDFWAGKVKPGIIIIATDNQEPVKILNVASKFNGSKIVLISDLKLQNPNIIGLKPNDDLSKNLLPILSENLASSNDVKEDILIKINDKYKRVEINEIEYIKADGKYLSLNLIDREYSVRFSLKNISLILPAHFIRVHSSYIINLKKIVSIHIQEQNIKLKSFSVPYSRKYKGELLERFHLG